MFMRKRLAVLLLALSAAFGQILPQRAAADAEGALRDFMGSSYYAALVQQALAALPPAEFRRCPTLVSNTSRVTILQPVAFRPNGFPASGLWRESFPVSGCGNDTIVNLFFLAEAGQRISVLIGMPGSTVASLILQTAAKKFTTIALQRVARRCRSFTVINTQFEGFGEPAPTARPWRESWTLSGCGHRYTVPIEFAPNKAGTLVTLPGGITSDR